MRTHLFPPSRRRTRLRRARQPWRWLPFSIRLRVARGRAWLVRHRLLRRTVAVTVLAASVYGMAGVVISARDARAAWGSTREVLVLTSDRSVGDAVGEEHVTRRSWPEALIPDDSIETIPSDDVAVRRLAAGEVLTRRDLRSTRPGVEVPTGQRALSLPRDPSIPAVGAGDMVDLHVVRVTSPELAGAAEVYPGVVIDVTDASYVVALDKQHAATLAGPLAQGGVVVALR